MCVCVCVSLREHIYLFIYLFIIKIVHQYISTHELRNIKKVLKS